MKTTDLFTNNRSAKRLNESLAKTFGQKLNLESFSIEQLEDARNKLRTQIYTARSSSNFNETVENETLSKAQFMHDAIVAELAERDEPIVDNTVQEEAQEFFVMLLGPRSGQSDPYHGPFNSPDEAQAWIDTESPNPEDYEVGEYPAGQFGQYDNGQPVQEGMTEGFGSMEEQVAKIMKQFDENMNEIGGYGMPDDNKIAEMLRQGDVEGALDYVYGSYADQDGGELRNMDNYMESLEDEFNDLAQGGDEPGASGDELGSFNQGEAVQNEAYINNAEDAINLLAAIRKQSKMAERGGGEPVRPNQLVNDLWDVMQWIETNMKESFETESAPPTAKGERMVKHIKKGYANDGKLTDKEKSIAYATAWKAHNKNENIEQTGDNMTRLREGEIQQASAIVTAKTMVDRVGRWIEELSGMENDTLLQLGDSIRDEMGQEQAKAFIQAVAPAIQQALDTLKGTRDTLSTGVRSLASGEQPADMLGAEPGADMAEPAEPDAMNPAGDETMAEPAADDFAAAEPAAGGLGDAGREQRESINRQSRLLKVLAG